MTGSSPDQARMILLRAIQIEARNAVIYESLANLFEGYDNAVTAIFQEMASEERRHGADLEGRYVERYGPVPSPLTESQEVIEAPDLADSEALIFDSMSVEQALKAGLAAEKSAREFYQEVALRCGDIKLQRIYGELAEFEETHVRNLEKQLLERSTSQRGDVR